MTTQTAYGQGRITVNGTTLLHADGVKAQRRQKTTSLDSSSNLFSNGTTIMSEAPVIEFDSLDLGNLIPKLSNADLPMNTISGGVAALMPAGSTTGPGFGSTGHKVATISAGQIWLNSLKWTKGNGASANVTAFAVCSDGTTDPMPITSGSTPVQLGRGVVYTLSSLTVGGTPVNDCQAFTLTIGHKATNDAPACYLNGLPRPTTVLGAGPLGTASIELSIEVLDQATDFSNGAIVAVFTTKSDKAIGLGSSTITVTLNAALVQAGDRSDGAPATRTITCTAAHDGTNRPLTLAAA